MWEVLIKCESGHEQVLQVDKAAMDEAMVRDWAALMDGSSPAYLSDPRDDERSSIGRCGICRARVTATCTELMW